MLANALLVKIFDTYYATSGAFLLILFPFVRITLVSLYWQLLKAFNSKRYKAFADKKANWSWPIFWGSLTGLLLAIISPDMFLLGRQAIKLCRGEAGLHVYRTVNPQGEGICGLPDLVYNYGFKFIEKERAGNKMRYLLDKDSKEVSEKIKTLTCRCQYSSEATPVNSLIELEKEQIRDRSTGEILGDAKTFVIDYGWADQAVAIFGSKWRCIGDGKQRYVSIDKLIRAVFRTHEKE